MRQPCYNCKSRQVGCHSGCRKYLEWKEEYATRDEEESEYLDYVTCAVQRMKGKGRWG